MSSSVKANKEHFPNWSLFTGRPLPEEMELLSPAAEIAAVLQQSLLKLEAEKHARVNVEQEYITMLAQQAVFLAQFSTTLERHRPKLEDASLNKIYRSLRIVKEQMRTALEQAGFEIIEPQGKSFDEVAEMVDVIGWRHHADFPSEIVAEVVKPIILYKGQVVQNGSVVMGAPEEIITP